MAERRRVNFRDSPPSSSGSSRHASDSGAGSVSDYLESNGVGGSGAGSNASSRGSTSTSRVSFDLHGSGDKWPDRAALEDDYRTALAAVEHWKNRAQDLEQEAINSRKQIKEAEAKWRSLVERNEQLEEEKRKILADKNTRIHHLEDEIDALQSELTEANTRYNEVQRNIAQPFAAGTSPGNPGSVNAGGGMDGLGSPQMKSLSTFAPSGIRGSVSKGSHGSSGGGGGGASAIASTSHSNSHSSSRAKNGTPSSSGSTASTAKISRSNSKHDSAAEQKKRLQQRFEHNRDDVSGGRSGDSSASASSAASSSSHKHHHSSSGHHGSSGSSGSSGSHGSSGSGESGGRTPRNRRQSYAEPFVEPFGRGAAPVRPNAMPPPPMPVPTIMSTIIPTAMPTAMPTSPNKVGSRGPPPPLVAPMAGGPPPGHYPTAFSPTQSHFGPPLGTPTYLPLRLDGSKGEIPRSVHPKVSIYDDTSVGHPYVDNAYYGHPASRDPAIRSRHAR